jgi:hypothetical protein
MAKGFGGSPFGKSKAPPFGGKGGSSALPAALSKAGAKANPFAKGAAAPAATAAPPADSFQMKKGGRVKKNKGGRAC